jgi:hypothetical protein
MVGVHVQHLTLYHIFDTTEYIHQVILMCISHRELYPSSIVRASNSGTRL